MTEEMIKQNAEAYATENYGEYDEHDYTDHSGSNMCHAVSEKAFIAGAHSRDEEIEELQNELESLRKGFYERGNKLKELIKKLMLANNKLRNPWISVEDRLPEEGQAVIVRLASGAGNHAACNYINGQFVWTLGIETSNINIQSRLKLPAITHWMPIQQIKKGE